MVPCTLNAPVKFFVYTAIVCNALLLLMPGLAFIFPVVYAKGPPVAVNVDTLVLGKNCAYAPSSTSMEPPAT